MNRDLLVDLDEAFGKHDFVRIGSKYTNGGSVMYKCKKVIVVLNVYDGGDVV